MKKFLIILMVLVVIILAGSAAAFFVYKNKAVENARDFYNKIQNEHISDYGYSSAMMDDLNENMDKINQYISSGVSYKQIKELDELVQQSETLYIRIFNDYKDGVGEGISDSAYYVSETASQYGLDNAPYAEIFSERVTNKFEQAKTFKELNEVSAESGKVFSELLEQIKQDAGK